MTDDQRHDRILATLLGTAVGDALGLPREGLSATRARRLFGDEIRHAFLLGHGMVSDDTEHTCLLGQALLASRGDPRRFARALAWKLRFWILGLPAGVGLGTARAIGKLWLGFPPDRSGVRSAGNGPAMRAALLGVCLGEDTARLREWVRAATCCTHTDPRAERAAYLTALAAAHAAARPRGGIDPIAFLARVGAAVDDADEELRSILDVMREHISRGAPLRAFAEAIGVKGKVSGYAYRTVPVALYAWLRDPGDFAAVVANTIRLGGDTDTTAAIAGAVCGAGAGTAGIPRAWVDGLLEWPRSVAWMRELANRLAERFSAKAADAREVNVAWPLVLPRNLLFLAIVLLHGFRRLLPPY
jgi:ADP-ribosyl-[dinitrogen reductase] hydrolase